MAKAKLGTKRVCPETEKKFYDLEKDPVVSPYTGKQYPVSFFETKVSTIVAKKPVEPKPKEKKVEDEPDSEAESSTETDDGGPEIISLEDAEEEEAGTDKDTDDDTDEEIPDIPDIPEAEESEENATGDVTVLETDEEDDDLSDVIGGVEEKQDEA